MASTWFGRQAGSSPLRAVDDIVQVAPFGVPEALVEGRVGLLRMLGQALCGLVSLLFAYPAFEQAQGVIPEGIDLDRFAAPRRHHPITDFGIHPGQLIALLPLAQQAILRIDAECRSACRADGARQYPAASGG